MRGGSVVGGTVVGPAQRPGPETAGRAGTRAAAVEPDRPGTRVDPSRVAARIVSGIGFIGGGLIFVRRDAVRGLTTAATVWLTRAVGMACGGGLPTSRWW
ncbi:hypothetical protein Shyhy01_60110 [Streptomyces hygroscopicus subsp. hygroscopicus]|nr:hypothetical protein Shyhy01_60110 [Streptomyces hygroscopicus subsp. hygroscopicus]